MSTPARSVPDSGPDQTRILVLVGPTASGKSSLAVALAEWLAARSRPAEIVNADSMLIYRGMDIGTAKPAPAERARIPHHLVDVAAVTETASVAEFQRRARAAIADCRRRGVLPIVVGGSALYIRAVVDELEFHGTDPMVRKRWEEELVKSGSEALHERLAVVDPAAAAAIQPGNGRRIVRALEVIELTGRPFTARLPERRYHLPGVAQIGLAVDRAVLDRRIEERVESMWTAGLVAEVAELSDRGLREGLTASRALGYRQVLELLDGEVDEDEARRRTVVATRKFARRQDAWFRQDHRIIWLAHDRTDLVEAALGASGLIGGRTGTGVED
jgi:tRNA dimethylallyltransferase